MKNSFRQKVIKTCNDYNLCVRFIDKVKDGYKVKIDFGDFQTTFKIGIKYYDDKKIQKFFNELNVTKIKLTSYQCGIGMFGYYVRSLSMYVNDKQTNPEQVINNTNRLKELI